MIERSRHLYYARMTKFNIRQGCDADAEEALKELYTWLQQQQGLVLEMQMAAHDNPRQRARLSIWMSKADADAAATQTHSIALRARLLAAAKEEVEDYEVRETAGSLSA